MDNQKNKPPKESREPDKTKWDQTHLLIQNVDRRIHYFEDRRTQFLKLGSALTAASIAAIFAFTNSIDRTLELNITQGVYWSFLWGSLVLCIGSLYLIFKWNKQNNPPYGFTDKNGIWRWQYRFAEKTPQTTILKKDGEGYKNAFTQTFQANLSHYVKRTIEATNEELFEQDISQLYLLLINEKSKINMVNSLKAILMNTFYCTAATVVISFFYFLVQLFGYPAYG